MSSLLTVNSLSKAYRGSDKKAVDGISLELNGGEIFGFLGPNGAGKSTTIKCLTGIYAYQDGEIIVCGDDLKKNPVAAKKHIGYVPDEHIFYENLKAIDYINFIADVYEVEESLRKERVERLTALLGLSDRLNEKISSYSHGMKQKLSVVCALVHDPEIWILDEPMTGLDPQSSFNLKQLMVEHAAAGKLVFFSSHVLEVVEKVCTRVAIIDNGKIIADGNMDELKAKRSDESLEELFLGLTKEAEEASQSVEIPQAEFKPKRRGLFGRKDDLL